MDISESLVEEKPLSSRNGCTSKDISLSNNKDFSDTVPQLLLVTVEYPGTEDNETLKDLQKENNFTVPSISFTEGEQLNILQPMDNIANTVLQYRTYLLKEFNNHIICEEGKEESSPVVFLKSPGPCESKKGSAAGKTFDETEQFLDSHSDNNIVIAPLPETVVDASLTSSEVSGVCENALQAISLKGVGSPQIESEIITKGFKKENEVLLTIVKKEKGNLDTSENAEETILNILDDQILDQIENEENHEPFIELGGWELDSSLGGIVKKIIPNKPVTCRARASLPANFLYISRISSDQQMEGVFAKKEISKRTQFGPLEGVIHSRQEEELSSKKISSSLHFSLSTLDGKFQKIDVSNPYLSNWMRFVRPADVNARENMLLYEWDGALYFTTIKTIKAGQELRVWYSKIYASVRSLPLELEFDCKRNEKKAGSPDHIRNSWTLQKNPAKYYLRNHQESLKSLQREKKQSVLSDIQKEEMKENGRKWRCTHCHCCFSTATLLNLHMLTHAADDLETSSPSSGGSESDRCNDYLGDESQIEDENKPLKCNICTKRFRNNSALACHIKSHADEKKFECPICNVVFDKVLGLKSHIRSHSTNGSFSCSYCSKKFVEYKHIRKHIRTFHSGRNHKCGTCSKKFPTLDKLRMHELSHSDHRQFLCANCGKQFKRKDKLSEHMKKSHFPHKEKPPPTSRPKHPKKFIPKMLGNMNDFSQFIYKCYSCMIGFKRRGMLVNHLANRHPDIAPESVPELSLPILRATKDYYCTYCDKIYKSSSKRKAHILKNHPGAELPAARKRMVEDSDGDGIYSQTVGSITTDPQACSWCHKQYASKAKLLQHQRSKHPNCLPTTLQKPRRVGLSVQDDIELPHCDEIGKITESDVLLEDSFGTGISEYEITGMDSHFITEGEFIIDAPTLKKALKGEIMSAECLPESISELGQLIADSRPDQYFKVIQTSSGISYAQPVEIWDPMATLGGEEEELGYDIPYTAR